MIRRSLLGGIFVVVFSVAAPAEAQLFEMKPLRDDPKVEPKIIGGRKSIVTNWPATFSFNNCTSTAIGPRVLLTAAHCVKHRASGRLTVGGTAIDFQCEHHPDYIASVAATGGKTTSADWALCVAISGSIPAKSFEVINTRVGQLKRGSEILLTGFGCNAQGGSDGGYGVQYEGEANINPVKNETDPDGLPNEQSPLWARNYATAIGGAAVCYGDSGGAAYLFLDEAKQSRVVIGVNSRGNVSTVSYLSLTSAGAFESWIRSWADTWADKLNLKNLEICGISAKTITCHP